MKTVLLGVTGSIAAYKAADLASGLAGAGCDVQVVMTGGAARFITPLTLQTLSKNRVYTDVFQEEDPRRVMHIDLAEKADLFLVAPASANVIGKLAWGLADDMLTAAALAVRDIPLLAAPAMNTNMYANPAVQHNLETLAARGWEIIPPKESRLACGVVGRGALAGVSEILKVTLERLSARA